jgi:2-polyprenyl-6-methoxyphenol hydroxylase-like FAD-dependent oxidoreductase
VQAVVVGAGIGGLTSAVALSRLGYEVVVVERDDTPMPDDVEAAFAWDRRGAPQVRHTHGFPALLRVLLRDRYPDVLQALLDAGVEELPIAPPGAPDDDLVVLSCRRTTLEWALRRCVLAEPGVRFAVGQPVAGLLAGGRPLGVRGVRLADGTEVRADVVVAATGRRDAVPAWFAEHGIALDEEEHPTGTIYLSRFYRGEGDPIGYVGGRRAGIGFVVAGADHGTYSATLAVPADDAELRAHLLDVGNFEAVLPLFREMAPVVARGGTPITGVQAMGGLVNRIRRFVDADGAPLAAGFFAVGDAHTCTNPLYGRGSSLAVLQAVLAADALTAHPDDLTAAARAYEDASRAKVEPWYEASLQSDTGSSSSRLDLGALRRIVASGDPDLVLLVMKTMTLLLTPDELFSNPAVVERLAAAAEPPPRQSTRPSLTRDDLLRAGGPTR